MLPAKYTMIKKISNQDINENYSNKNKEREIYILCIKQISLNHS